MQAPSAPGTGDQITWADHKGTLLYFTVHELVRDVATVHGASDAIRADVALLDGPNKGDTFTDILVFPKVLRGQLAGAVDNDDPAVIGRLGQGTAKPGKSAPWMLDEPTDADMAIGAKYEQYAKATSEPGF